MVTYLFVSVKRESAAGKVDEIEIHKRKEWSCANEQEKASPAEVLSTIFSLQIYFLNLMTV